MKKMGILSLKIWYLMLILNALGTVTLSYFTEIRYMFAMGT